MDTPSARVSVRATLTRMATGPGETLAYRKHSDYPAVVAKNVLVRNVPDSVHSALVRRADAEGKSLQEYLLGVLQDLTDKPTMTDVMDDVRALLAKNPGPLPTRDDIVATIRAHRDA